MRPARLFLIAVAAAATVTDSSADRKPAAAENLSERKTVSGKDCGTLLSPPLAAGNSAAELHSTVRDELAARVGRFDQNAICKPGDTRDICRLARSQASADEQNTPRIRISLQKNQTDTSRVDLIQNTTRLSRTFSRLVTGGAQPRSSRSSQILAIDDSVLRRTEGSGRDHSVRVWASVGNQPDLALRIGHTTKDMKIEENRRTEQHQLKDKEEHDENGITRGTEKQEGLRESQDSSIVEETTKTLSITFSSDRNGGVTDGYAGKTLFPAIHKWPPMPVKNWAKDPLRNNPSPPTGDTQSATFPGTLRQNKDMRNEQGGKRRDETTRNLKTSSLGTRFAPLRMPSTFPLTNVGFTRDETLSHPASDLQQNMGTPTDAKRLDKGSKLTRDRASFLDENLPIEPIANPSRLVANYPSPAFSQSATLPDGPSAPATPASPLQRVRPAPPPELSPFPRPATLKLPSRASATSQGARTIAKRESVRQTANQRKRAGNQFMQNIVRLRQHILQSMFAGT